MKYTQKDTIVLRGEEFATQSPCQDCERPFLEGENDIVYFFENNETGEVKHICGICFHDNREYWYQDPK